MHSSTCFVLLAYRRYLFRMVLLFLVMGFNSLLSAQSYRINYYQRDQGLPNELIKSITVDSLGALWLASDEGLISFNGLNFEQFATELGSNYVKAVYTTRAGEVFVASDMGVFRLVHGQGGREFQSLVKGHSQPTDTTVWYPKQFYEDAHTSLWFSDNNAIWRYKDGRCRLYPRNEKHITMSWQRSFSFVEDGYGHLFAFSQRGTLLRYLVEEDAFTELEQPLRPGDVSHALQVEKGLVLVAATAGVLAYRFDSLGNVIEIKPLTLPLDVSFLLPIDGQNVWVGSWTQGLYRLRNYRTTPQLERVNSYEPNIVSYMLRGPTDEFWAASDNGLCLLQANFCEAPYSQFSKAYTQAVHQHSESELYFTDGDHIFRVHPARPFEAPQVLNAPKGRYYLSFTSVGNRLLAGDAAGGITVFENGKVLQFIDLSQWGTSIFEMKPDAQGNVWWCQDGLPGLGRISPSGHAKTYTAPQGLLSSVYCLAISKSGELYAGGAVNGKFLFRYNTQSDKFENISRDFVFGQPRDIVLYQMAFQGDSLWLASSYGLGYYHNAEFKALDYGMPQDAIKAVTVDKAGALWFASSVGVMKLHRNELFVFDETAGLPTKTVAFRGLVTDSYNRIWAGTNSGLSFFPNTKVAEKTPTPYFVEIRNNEHTISPMQRRFLDNSLFQFKFTSASFPKKYLHYQWRLLGRNEQWQRMESLDALFLSNLPSGEYTLEIRCRQNGNFLWSEALQFSFVTHRAWYYTWWAVLLYLLFLALLVGAIVRYNTQRLLRQKEQLERLVLERTTEVNRQKHQILEKNEELNQSNEELHTTLELVKFQKDELELSHKNITDSINYAHKIQTVMLPPAAALGQWVREYFVFFQPRDIVSGDFYWFRQVRQYLYLAVADCTGHGVPGAFMSMLGISQLAELINEQHTDAPHEILNELRRRIIRLLHQQGSEAKRQDGMDMALCRIDLHAGTLLFAGANCHLYQVTQKAEQATLLVHKGDMMPIGSYPREADSFSNKQLQTQPGDTLYLFSDGYVSQFGGDMGHKFMSNRFQQILLKVQHLPLAEQKMRLEETLYNWQGKHRRVDDVLVMGVKL